MIKVQQIIYSGESIMTFGRYRGSRVKNLPNSYLWALYKHGWIKIAKKYYKSFQQRLNKSRPIYIYRYHNDFNQHESDYIQAMGY